MCKKYKKTLKHVLAHSAVRLKNAKLIILTKRFVNEYFLS